MSNLKSIAQKLRYTPQRIKGAKLFASQAHLGAVKETIIDGLLKNNLVSPPLKESTIKLKKNQKKPRIYTALVGWGKQKTDSMINGLKVIKQGNKFYLKPVGKHYSKLPQDMIWKIHEYGAIITNGFGKGILIRIPPRFPLRRGVQRYLRSQVNKTTNKELEKYLKAIIEDNKTEISKLQSKFEKRSKAA